MTVEPLVLGDIKLTEIRPVQALFDGIRIHPLRTRFAFTADGELNTTVSPDLLSRLFQSVNRPEEVRFLYSINDSGTGRELQNQRVFNVASLGIANGERPFKVFHKPMHLSAPFDHSRAGRRGLWTGPALPGFSGIQDTALRMPHTDRQVKQ